MCMLCKIISDTSQPIPSLVSSGTMTALDLSHINEAFIFVTLTAAESNTDGIALHTSESRVNTPHRLQNNLNGQEFRAYQL